MTFCPTPKGPHRLEIWNDYEGVEEYEGVPIQYPKNHMLIASRFTQNDLIEARRKEPNTAPVMTTKYNPHNPNIKGFIHDNWNVIQHSNDCSNTVKEKPIIGFKILQNLGDMLTKPSISYPPSNMETTKPIINTQG